MAIANRYAADVEALLARRHENGADFWATPDGRWGKGSPFSTFDCALMLHELGMKRSDPVLRGAAEVIFAAWQEDGRFRAAPKGSIYPCHTANAARVLGRLGFARDARLKRTYAHLLETTHDDGGWRCKKKRLGFSPETDASNPGVTLAALDALRFSALREDKRIAPAVRTLLDHWDIRRPWGPCHFGIGTLFMQVEYPFLRYNLFFWVYALSFLPAARRDARFLQAWRALQSKVVKGGLVVENPNRRLAPLSFCRKGEVSALATRRLREIEKNLA